MARKAASSTRFATSRMTTEASVWVIVLLYKRLMGCRLGNALEFSRRFLRTMRPLLGNRAEMSGRVE